MNRDFSDLLSGFNAHGVEYLVVGAHALAAHGQVRATKDLDVWVRPDSSNAGAVMAALHRVHPLDGRGVQGIRSQGIQGVGGKGHQATAAQSLASLLDDLRLHVPWVHLDHSCLH